MVIEASRPITRVAKELGINEGTLGNWVSSYRRERVGEEPPITVSERVRLRESEREIRELKMENAFLKSRCVTKAEGPPGGPQSLLCEQRGRQNVRVLRQACGRL
jgi:transposase-like protein